MDIWKTGRDLRKTNRPFVTGSAGSKSATPDLKPDLYFCPHCRHEMVVPAGRRFLVCGCGNTYLILRRTNNIRNA